MAARIEEMISEEAIDARIRELGRQITEDYKGKDLHLVCVLRGAVFFMCELAKRIELPVRTFRIRSPARMSSLSRTSSIRAGR